jgi:hypothetical protein
MHFRLPKPLHGWREFAKEVGIIVLGVLIALGAEQAVTALHSREEVSDTKRAIGAEIGASVRYAAIRLAVQQCLGNRIAELGNRLKSNETNWAADPMPIGRAQWMVQSRIPAAYRTPSEPWRTDAWDTAKATGILNHLSRDEVAAYSINYDAIAELRHLDEAETALEPELSVLSFDQTLDERSRLEAIRALAKLDWVNGNMATLSGHLVSGIATLHLKLDRRLFAERLRQDLAEQRRIRGPCVQEVNVSI